MATIQELIALGEKMGLKAESLQDFVKEQQTLARDERDKQRALEKEKLQLEKDERDKQRELERENRELEREKLQLGKDERDKQRELEKERLQLEKDKEQNRQAIEAEKEANRKMELEIKKQQLELKEKESSEDGGSDAGSIKSNDEPLVSKAKGPKMSPLDDRDDIDSYLHRFERYAELQGWKKTSWAIYLAALLKGKALDVYARLPKDESQDYDQLKEALLRRYQMTEEGYKRRFYTGRAEVGESPRQFITRLYSYLERWVELAQVEETFEGLAALIVREQYLSTCSKELELFLRERAVTDLGDLSKLAEQYQDAHVTGSAARRVGRTMDAHENSRAEGTESQRVAEPRGGVNKKCYTCGKVGHISKNCFKKARMGAMQPRFVNRSERPWQPYRRYEPNGSTAERGIESGPGNSPTPKDNLMYCRAHGKQYCPECFTSSPPDGHSCNALLAQEVQLKCGCRLPVLAEACDTLRGVSSTMPVSIGRLNGREVRVLRDTGCSTVVVRRDMVTDEQLTGKQMLCVLIDGTVRRTPVARVCIDTPFYKGSVEAVCMKRPMYDLIVGNIAGVQDGLISIGPERKSEPETPKAREQGPAVVETQAVTTRAQARKSKVAKPLMVAEQAVCNMPVEEVVKMQHDDSTLKNLWQKAENGETNPEGDSTVSFEVKAELLYRKKELHNGRKDTQLVVPEPLRGTVMRLAHDCILSGHLGIRKTLDRVAAHFFWPGVYGDVTRYCRSCDICQRTVAKGRVAKVPLCKMPLIEIPFQRVAVDLIGPIAPATERGHRFILTLIDYATRFPEAVPLKNIEAETVAEAMVNLFARVGVPEEILSDQGSQFVSKVMQETSRLLSMNQLTTTPYHPMCNGLVERFNGCLKAMLRRMCSERPKDWDRYLPALLFAYREVPQESLGFSPFELLYGRTVRGPMAVLKDLWTRQETQPEVKLTYQYVLELQERLEETCKIAKESLEKAQAKQKRHFDVRAKDRQFSPGDKVLLLLPSDSNKLLTQWKGPYEVLERRAGHNYRIQLPDKAKLFHANMLKLYTERQSQQGDMTEAGAAAVIEDEEEPDDFPTYISAECKETLRNVNVNPDLDRRQQDQIRQILLEFQDIFSDLPKVTNLGEHSINLTSVEPIRSKAYPVPYAMREVLDKEIDSMLQMGVIEPSFAPYASPVVIVKKADGSNRVCVDYRKLNKITSFDPEPIPHMSEIFADLAGSKYFSKFDFSKGYWQVPMREQDKDYTTFITHRGLFRFKVMPFGLVNAPATFSRLMRKLLEKLEKTKNYLDDVLTHAATWPEHLTALSKFFERVRRAKLVLRPSKCYVGYQTITFLGHQLGVEGLEPTQEMIKKIRDVPPPATKKQLRSFLGLVGYYRSYIPNFAAIAVPLTDLTKKGAPNQLTWGQPQVKAFATLKSYIANPPVLKLPDVTKPFILQTDASADGIGAILLQEENGLNHPVAFASKKLLPREKNYSTIEREALAIVWGVQKFQCYLYGQHFILETDHCPLQYLERAQFHNSRLMRWTLILQPYRFTLKAIKGSQNVGADFLSRHAC